MIDVPRKDGWERLANGFDVEFKHRIPVRISDNGMGLTVPEDLLTEEISSLGKLHVHLGAWTPGEDDGELEARVFADHSDFGEVLKRLGSASAAVFIDRYHKSIKTSDVDWDREAFLQDFHEALDYCELSRADVDEEACFRNYVNTMHDEVNRLAELEE